MSKYEDIKNTLAFTMAEDLEWLTHGRVPGQKPDPVHNPWMPFQMAEFVAIMAECVAQSEGNDFLDVGSGIGTKLQVAEDLFGLEVCGVEYDPTMHEHANDSGRFTVLQDALEFPHYGTFDIIWMYRPFRDPLAQAILEHKIYEAMQPGAIIAGAALCAPPNGFELVVDDWDVGCRGAWKKPANWKPVTYDFNEDE
jgi:SAM-dependent methyltransferase